jgi:hypothetical protein
MTVAGMSGMIRIAGGRPAIIAIVLAIWVVAVPLIRTLYRRLRSLLEPLQREVAVRMYLDEAGRTK